MPGEPTFPLSPSAAAQLVEAALPPRSLVCAAGTPPYVVSCRPGRPWDADRPAAVCAVGAFDGVHVGHQALVARAAVDAAARGVSCVGVTFDPDPAEVLRGAPAGERLLPPADRASLLLSCGADAVMSYPFTPAFADLGHREFVVGRLLGALDLRALHVGEDFRLGREGRGDVTALCALGTEHGFEVTGHPLVTRGGLPVTATRIRGLLRVGRVREANALLGRCHSVDGRVEHGRGEGAAMGFPTANVRFDREACLPAAGVYGGYVAVAGGAWPAAINVGVPPTFSAGHDDAFLEASLVGFSGDLYDEEVRVVFVARLRASRRFDDVGELRRAVGDNLRWVRSNLGRGRVGGEVGRP